MQAPFVRVVGVGAGTVWRPPAPTPRTAVSRSARPRRPRASPPFLGPLASRAQRRLRDLVTFGAGGLSWAAGMGQADLAARGQGAAGLAGLLGQQPAALGGGQEPLVDFAVV